MPQEAPPWDWQSGGRKLKPSHRGNKTHGTYRVATKTAPFVASGFEGGHFQIRVLSNTTRGRCLLPANGWAPIVAEGDEVTPSQIIDTYGEEVLNMVMRRPAGLSYATDDQQSKRLFNAELRGGVDARDAEFRLIMLENSTGHHYRNKHVSIPVAPGQPLRG